MYFHIIFIQQNSRIEFVNLVYFFIDSIYRSIIYNNFEVLHVLIFIYYEIVSLVEPKQLFGQIDHKFEISAECIKAREGLFDAK